MKPLAPVGCDMHLSSESFPEIEDSKTLQCHEVSHLILFGAARCLLHVLVLQFSGHIFIIGLISQDCHKICIFFVSPIDI